MRFQVVAQLLCMLVMISGPAIGAATAVTPDAAPAQIAGARRTVPRGVRALSAQMIESINSIGTTWKAGPNFSPSFNLKNLRALLGVAKDPSNFDLPTKQINVSPDLPKNFDAREKWPTCPSLREVRDQSNCGSCWAFATVESITDRNCIASAGKMQADISAQDLTTCCSGIFFGCGNGCHGGFPARAWSYWVKTGIVTGGLFNGTGCQPYAFPPHRHGEPYSDTPKCESKCSDSSLDYKQEKNYGLESYRVASPDEIQQEIFDRGSVGVDFTVHGDFPSYKSGVYQAHSEEVVGGHAVKLIGWGEESGIPYWLAVNSWNVEWGEEGLFKILRGSNHCGIENHVYAGTPKL